MIISLPWFASNKWFFFILPFQLYHKEPMITFHRDETLCIILKKWRLYMINIEKKTETNTQQSIFDMFVWKTVNVLQLQKNVQKIIIFLHFNLFLYMYLRIHLFCCKFHLCPRQHGVPLILKNLHICLKWLLTLKKKEKKNCIHIITSTYPGHEYTDPLLNVYKIVA